MNILTPIQQKQLHSLKLRTTPEDWVEEKTDYLYYYNFIYRQKTQIEKLISIFDNLKIKYIDLGFITPCYNSNGDFILDLRIKEKIFQLKIPTRYYNYIARGQSEYNETNNFTLQNISSNKTSKIKC